MMVYGIQFWIECKGGLKTANELSDVLDDLVYDGNLSLAYSNHSIMGAGLFMKNAVQNNFESIREILNEFADKIKYVSEWDYEDSSDMKWGVHTLGESKKSARKSMKESYLDEVTNLYFFDLDVDEECEVQLENFVMPCRISQFYKNDRHMYLIVQSKTSDETYFVITYNYKKNKFVSSKVFSSYREAKNQLVDTIAMVF